ncbi:MAG: heavy metal translocating P-type ATPase [Clostridia bacterium]|nr:heavy metal translocating P-type ATPase [Clostridia bacterium]
MSKHAKTAVRLGVSVVLFAAVRVFLGIAELDGLWGLLYLLPYAVVGYDVVYTAIVNIFHGRFFDERFLMTLATVVAFVIGQYPEAVAVMLFYQVGELFQSVAVSRSRKSIAALMDIKPESAVVIREGKEVEVHPEDVAIGEILLVRAGDKIALDGTIIDGNTSLDMKALTGESIPVDKAKGDSVLSGSVNLCGVIKVKTENTYGESTVSKILDLVENSAQKKAKAENFITKFAKYYTPIVVICAVLLAVIPSLISGLWSIWLWRAMMFLVVSCPCALVISVPLSFFGGVGGASREGILIKGSNYLEVLSKVGTVVFDKTGTLTEGEFAVREVCAHGIGEEELLKIAAHAESFSAHPIARSVVDAYKGSIDKSIVKEVCELAGRGLKAKVSGKDVCIGNAKLLEEEGIPFEKAKAGTLLYIAVDGEYSGYLVVKDAVKPNAKKAVEKLKALGITKTIMLTGDNQTTGEEIRRLLDIDEARCGLLPADKVDAVLDEEKKGKLAYVGDGINDAPVLACADVGIAMGALGSDAAIEAADIVLMNDNPEGVAKAIKIARKTMKIVYENIIFALVIKFGVLVLASFGVLDSMWLAVFADVGVSVIAIINAMRALRKIKE